MRLRASSGSPPKKPMLDRQPGPRRQAMVTLDLGERGDPAAAAVPVGDAWRATGILCGCVAARSCWNR